MVRSLSTWLAVILISSVGACADAKGRFDDFGNRVIDAGTGGAIDARRVDGVPDINGQFLMTIVPVPISPDSNISYIADVVMTDADGEIRLDVELRALDFRTMEPVNPDAPDVWEGVLVNRNTAEFDLPLEGTTIPGRANSAVPGLAVTVTGNIHAVILSRDVWCGTLTGRTQLGSSLNGSTVGAIRIEPGTLGEDLPPPVRECPAVDEVDAGVPDAGIIADAAPDDAAPDDAAPDDAAPDDAAPDDATPEP
jgi:hypothetical protein